jgi:hypothetical protein
MNWMNEWTNEWMIEQPQKSESSSTELSSALYAGGFNSVDWQSPSISFHGADPSSLLSLHSVPMLFRAQKYTLNLCNITLVPTKVRACDIEEFCSVNMDVW